MPTTVIDNTWLASPSNGGPNGPWLLATAGQTYQLSVDVTALGSAFRMTANNITFDLNGHTVSFGNRTQPTVLNPYFSDNVTVPGKPDHWDVTGASAASVVPITDHVRPRYGFRDWAPNCLKLGPLFSTTQVILSEAISIPTANVEYCVNVLACTTANSYLAGTSLKTEVIDQVTGSPIGGSSTATKDNLGNGASVPFFFTPVTTNSVKIRFTVTPPTGTPTTVYMSGVIFKTSTLRGLAHTLGFATTTLIDSVGTGSIVCANDNPVSPCLKGTGDSIWYITGINASSKGLDSHIFDLKYCTGTIDGCTLTDGGMFVSDRQTVIAGILLDHSGQGHSIPLEVKNCTLVDCKHYGIYVAQAVAGSRIHHNDISPNSHYTNAYGIAADDCVSGLEIDNNIVHPVAGRGIICDMFNFAWGPLLIHHNTVTVQEQGNLEFAPNGLEPACVRLRNINQYDSPDVRVYDNTFVGICGSTTTHATACIRPTNRRLVNPVSWQFLRNNCKAIITNPSALPTVDTTHYAAAVVLDRSVVPGSMLFEDNTFESNCISLALGDLDSFGTVQSNTLFRSNTFKQNTLEGTQTGYVPIQIGGQSCTVGPSLNLVGNIFDGSTPAPDYSANAAWGDWTNKAKEVNVGWLCTVTITDSSTGLPISGATVLSLNNSAVVNDTQTTDGSGQASLQVITDLWSRAGGWTQTKTHTVLGPHTLQVSKTGYTPSTVSIGTLAANGTQTIQLNPLGGGGGPGPPVPQQRRRSSWNFPILSVLPVPTGSIPALSRIMVQGYYGGLSAESEGGGGISPENPRRASWNWLILSTLPRPSGTVDAEERRMSFGLYGGFEGITPPPGSGGPPANSFILLGVGK